MTLRQRHKQADKILNKLVQPAIENNSVRPLAATLAKKYGITGQTVINYFYGQGKDGFLKQCLIEDIKNV